ncbi:unnamed protein product [Xylocopa violacea]|uniref:Uncharacterized protein n=1 Tax=Xylocopa violacea TaxID=135666 RepID=A0ABP1N6F9_XYLVO
MFLPKDLLFFSLFTILIVCTIAKFPTGAPWASIPSKPVYSRALGPPVTGMDTITIPYMPKSPFFPKFVDPKMMISKKTDLLSNLFGGLGPVYPMGYKPFMPYAASGSPLYSTSDETQPLNSMGKSTADDGTGFYKRGIFGPFGTKPFGSASSKFGPMSQFSSVNAMPDYDMKSDFSRRRRSIDESPVAKLRSIMDTGKPETKDLGPPPPYPTLAPISEESEEDVNVLLKKVGGETAPKQYLPGFPMFGPFGPFGPVVDPTMFMAKKSAFLDTLFKNLATTTTPSPISTETPTTKSTIVPPEFWLPSSVIPSPTEYNEKLDTFLDKLFETLKLNKTMAASDSSANVKNVLMRSIPPDNDIAQAKISRSIDDLSSINAAKDSIVNNILSELGDLKSNMVTTMNDLISYEKTATSLPPKKPFKPFGPPGPWSKPTTDGVLPFQQKMVILSQVFDMLTDLQKNITLAIENVIKAKVASSSASEAAFNANYPMTNDILYTTGGLPFNMSLLDAVKGKLDTFDYGVSTSYNPSFDRFGAKVARSPASFWPSNPEDIANIKREVNNGAESLTNEENNFDQRQQTRSVKMQMHQGYQSLPAGSIESVQAGGGSSPGHQGGGLKLFDTSSYEDFDKWANWAEYMRNNYQGHRHHNHH